MSLAPLTVAVGQPRIRAGDVAANAAAHAALIRATPADLWVFPELSLTGYDLTAGAIAPADDALQPLLEACAVAGAIALVGAPVVSDDACTAIATLLVTADGTSVAYRKNWLGADEAARFTAGTDTAVVLVHGWRVALGICRDTGVPAHVDAVAALAPDLYVAGVVHHAAELDEQDRRGQHLATACAAPVAFASFAGATGHGYAQTAGHSTIWSRHGDVLARAGRVPDLAVTACLEPPASSRR